MSIYLVRHSDKENGEYYSEYLPMNNQPLSESGIIKARKLVDFFKNIEISAIYVSEYIRTGQTIEYVSKSKGLDFIIDKRLNEINIGDTDKLSDEEIQSKYPEFWTSYLERESDFRFPNGESGEEACSRIFELFNSLDIKQNMILVSHDGIIRSLICKILELPPFQRHRFKIDLCSITTCEYLSDLKAWQIVQMNLY